MLAPTPKNIIKKKIKMALPSSKNKLSRTQRLAAGQKALAEQRRSQAAADRMRKSGATLSGTTAKDLLYSGYLGGVQKYKKKAEFYLGKSD